MKITNTYTKLVWSKPAYFFLPWRETSGKRRVTNFEGGNRALNRCTDPSNPRYDPTLNRCFNRGPS